MIIAANVSGSIVDSYDLPDMIKIYGLIKIMESPGDKSRDMRESKLSERSGFEILP